MNRNACTLQHSACAGLHSSGLAHQKTIPERFIFFFFFSYQFKEFPPPSQTHGFCPSLGQGQVKSEGKISCFFHNSSYARLLPTHTEIFGACQLLNLCEIRFLPSSAPSTPAEWAVDNVCEFLLKTKIASCYRNFWQKNTLGPHLTHPQESSYSIFQMHNLDLGISSQPSEKSR